MSPEEMLNIAYQEEVEAEPTANIPDMHLIESDIQNMSPLQVVRIPLYIALSLKRSSLCRIRLPSYLRESYLEDVVKLEKENEGEYSKIPHYLFELSDVLIHHAYNTENPERLKVLVQEIKDLRFRKTLEGMKALDGRAFNVNGLTEWEFGEVRSFILKGSEEANKFIGKKQA